MACQYGIVFLCGVATGMCATVLLVAMMIGAY